MSDCTCVSDIFTMLLSWLEFSRDPIILVPCTKQAEKEIGEFIQAGVKIPLADLVQKLSEAPNKHCLLRALLVYEDEAGVPVWKWGLIERDSDLLYVGNLVHREPVPDWAIAYTLAKSALSRSDPSLRSHPWPAPPDVPEEFKDLSEKELMEKADDFFKKVWTN